MCCNPEKKLLGTLNPHSTNWYSIHCELFAGRGEWHIFLRSLTTPFPNICRLDIACRVRTGFLTAIIHGLLQSSLISIFTSVAFKVLEFFPVVRTAAGVICMNIVQLAKNLS